MTDQTVSLNSQATARHSASNRAATTITLFVFAATLFLSAFLLFSVQPFFTKLVLPKLGGTPAVWSIAMVFFQTMLLAGYGYAHLLTTKMAARTGAYVHLAVMVAALFLLPIAIPDGWSQPPDTGQAVWLLALFALAVGVPFFAVSANGPLLQAWFARTNHPHAADPYFLYGASNIGSFASLILYVVLFEPVFTLGSQSIMWTAGFIGLGVAVVLCAFLSTRSRSSTPTMAVTTDNAPAELGKTTFSTKLQWIGLAFIPSGLLVAVTAHIAVDVASAPFIWIVPLALFLLTFVFAFARKNRVPIRLLDWALPVLAAAVITSLLVPTLVPITAEFIIHFGFFFAAALLAHTVLASKRPHASQLTEFYFLMSAGGVLGGVFASLIAPITFEWMAEYPILVIAALMIRPAAWTGAQRATRIAISIGLALAVIINLPPLVWIVQNLPFLQLIMMTLMLVAVGLIVRLRDEPAFAVILFVTCGMVFALQGRSDVLYAERSFFGVLEAKQSQSGDRITMSHGTTIHGAMLLDETGTPTPITYYHSSGGIADSLFAIQRAHEDRHRQIGIVGLGVGSLICHRQPNETWTHFEIDKDVVDLARNADYFRFMSECETDQDSMIIGDARISLTKQADQSYDYLLVDAFSSDAIPVHLLTSEALQLYRSKIKDDGIIVIHISNRYMELPTVVAATAAKAGLAVRIGRFKPDEASKKTGAYENDVAVLAATHTLLDNVLTNHAWETQDPGETVGWTDDYSNVLAAIVRQFRGKQSH